MISCDLSSHEAFGTPRKLFSDFFRVTRDVPRELLGDQWSTERIRLGRNNYLPRSLGFGISA